MTNRSGYATALVVSGLCLALTGSVCQDAAGASDDVVAKPGSAGLDAGPRSKRFVVVNGDGVPDYDDIPSYDYDDWYDDDVYEHGHDHDHGHGGGGGGGGDDHGGDDDDDDDDYYYHGVGPGFHHVWWHHFYHHGEPHLPFPLFPPVFIHRRPVHRGCKDWPFACRSTYEVIQWLQCYHEIVHGHHGFSSGLDDHGFSSGLGDHGFPSVHVHAWRK